MLTARFSALAASLLSTACTSFATVRSAEVLPGPTMSLQVSATTPSGDHAGWFWSYDCGSQCGHSITAGDLGLTLGTDNARGPALAIAAGINGSDLYLDGYVQIGRDDRRPYGVGARAGFPLTGWSGYQVYGRYDVRLDRRTRLLINPGILHHSGQSPNGQHQGSFVALVQGVGLLLEGRRVSTIPALSLVLGSARRRSYGERIGPAGTALLVLSISVAVHRERSP